MKKSKFSIAYKDEALVELVSKTEHKILAAWAIDCVERVMQYFDEKHPEDPRPRQAIETLQTWINTGCLKWQSYVALHSHRMRLLVKWMKTMQLAPLPGRQVRQLQLHMSPLILLVLQTIPCRPFTEPAVT